MSETNNNVETTITTENIDIDAMFGAGADNVTLPETKPSIFSKPDTVSVDNISTPEPQKETPTPEAESKVDDAAKEEGAGAEALGGQPRAHGCGWRAVRHGGRISFVDQVRRVFNTIAT